MSSLKPQYLCLTSGLFSISLFIYFLTSNKNLEKNILSFTLFLCLVFSQLFWYNPIQHSLTHKIDAIIAKINAFLFVCFILFFKKVSWSVKFWFIFKISDCL
jgi:hypothetical protein